MKRITLFILILCCIAGGAQAATQTLYAAGGALHTQSYTLLSAVTGTGAGTASTFTYLGRANVPISKHMCTGTWGGTANPTQVVFTLDCAEDGANYAACASVTMTASPTIFHVDKPGVVGVRGNVTSFTGGTAPTFTLTCTSGGQ